MSRTPDFAIEVENLSKRYRLGVYDSNLRQTIADGVGRIARVASGRPSPPRAEPFWALEGVSFTIPQGELLGVIGHNGAGKSTLLKILSRITEPTHGRVRLRGRVGSLLEVGTGFDPELTGRDNVFLNGAVLGMTHAEIQRRFDEIVDFSGVEAFIDTPVKRYSSGMYMRLAFAVAAHLESAILLVDEVLAVGDLEFQEKCLARMGEMTGGGRTVVLVSHNVTAIQSLCRRCLLLEKGVLVADGPTRQVIARYLGEGEVRTLSRAWPAHQAPANDVVSLRGLRLEPAEGQTDAALDITRAFRIVIDYVRLPGSGRPNVALMLRDNAGVLVFDISNSEPPPARPGAYVESCLIPADLLNAGRYTLSVVLYSETGPPCELPDVLTFDLLDSGRDRHGWFGDWNGVLRPRFEWRRVAARAAEPASAARA
jgi:lipopolysaccharide transport system ATP-binding protein